MTGLLTRNRLIGLAIAAFIAITAVISTSSQRVSILVACSIPSDMPRFSV